MENQTLKHSQKSKFFLEWDSLCTVSQPNFALLGYFLCENNIWECLPSSPHFPRLSVPFLRSLSTLKLIISKSRSWVLGVWRYWKILIRKIHLKLFDAVISPLLFLEWNYWWKIALKAWKFGKSSSCVLRKKFIQKSKKKKTETYKINNCKKLIRKRHEVRTFSDPFSEKQ